MLDRSSIAAIALMAALVSTIPAAQAFDDAKYPDLKGAWHRALAPMPRFDPSKPRGLAQQPPLTPEFQALFEASLPTRPPADRAITRSIPAWRGACRR